ncbi:hypothetical protein PENTCL1PPCAC_21964, partial [Pristionchus entomophagus]
FFSVSRVGNCSFPPGIFFSEMGQDKLNFDRPEEEIIAEAKERGYEYYYKPVPWLKVGEYVKINDRPYKVTEITTGKSGKHGKMGFNKYIAGVDVFTGEKRETHIYECNVCIPFVQSKEYMVINLTHEGVLTLMDEETSEQKEFPIPEDALGVQIREAFLSEDVKVTVVTALREERITKF